MANLGQTKELEESLHEVSRKVGERFDHLSEGLSRAAKACRAFAVDFNAFQDISLDKEKPEGKA